MSSPILQLNDVQTHFPVESGFLFRHQVGTVKAVDGITLSVQRGEVLGLVGESGCGKSTLARTIMQLVPTTAGTVLLEGRNLTAASAAELLVARRDLQMIFQDPFASLNPRLTVYATLAEPLLVHRVVPPEQVRARRGLGRKSRSVVSGAREISPRILRRATSAYRDRAGPRTGTQGHHRR